MEDVEPQDTMPAVQLLLQPAQSQSPVVAPLTRKDPAQDTRQSRLPRATGKGLAKQLGQGVRMSCAPIYQPVG